VLENRAAAVTAVEQTCPRCGEPRDSAQEYCLECGFRLPIVRGRLPRLRRRWLRRFGWYPGDWIWVSLLTFAVAAGGAAVSIWFTSNRSGYTSTVVAPAPRPATTTKRTTLPAAQKPKSRKTTTVATTTGVGALPAAAGTARSNGQAVWPAGENGWTLVLSSYPTAGGRAVPEAAAARAARSGLPEVGILDSADYSSLHPGYYVVFSGVYSSQAEAEAALATAHAGGFGGAYTREISR
jgi:hypothetical protein